MLTDTEIVEQLLSDQSHSFDPDEEDDLDYDEDKDREDEDDDEEDWEDYENNLRHRSWEEELLFLEPEYA
jgi:hypothetical protein